MTNYEHIKNMSLEEMTSFFNICFHCMMCPEAPLECDGRCDFHLKEWLEGEVDENYKPKNILQ